MIAIKKHSSKLKGWSVKMPNAPYSKRCVPCKEMPTAHSSTFGFANTQTQR